MYTQLMFWNRWSYNIILFKTNAEKFCCSNMMSFMTFVEKEFAISKACVRTLQWHQNDRDGVSNHEHHNCLLNHLFRRRSQKTSKLRVSGLCEGNSPVTGEFHAQRASNAENVSIWWRHNEFTAVLFNIWLLHKRGWSVSAMFIYTSPSVHCIIYLHP